jgi:hypothetical protein
LEFHEEVKVWGLKQRDSVLECSSPLELFGGGETLESAGGPAHSRTLSRQ